MKNKRMLPVFVFSLLVLLVIMVGGCSVGVSSSTKTYYYYPDWTPDGRIVCSKNVQTVSGGSGPTPGTDIASEYYLAIMDANGSNESNIRRIENGAKVAASPLGNYYAYSCWDPSSSYIIRVVDKNGNNVALLNLTTEVYDLDWSPDEKEIVFNRNSTISLFIFRIATGQVSEITSVDAASPSWRYNDRIVFFNRVSGVYHLSFSNSDGTVIKNTDITSEAGNDPQYTKDGIFIMTIGDGAFKKISVTQEAIVETVSHSINNSVWNIRFSPNVDKIIGTGQNLSGAEIWIANLNGSGLKQLK